MNTERMLLLADAIDKGPIDGTRFNMESFYNSRTATACIAGMAVIYFRGKDALQEIHNNNAENLSLRNEIIREAAREELGLTESQAEGLFRGKDDPIRLSAVPKDVAVAVLRRFVKVGTINWPDKRPGFEGYETKTVEAA